MEEHDLLSGRDESLPGVAHRVKQMQSLLVGAEEERRARMREALHPDWHRSVWIRREIVQRGPDKLHVATRFARQREDGSEITAFDSLYVVAFQDGRWGIKGRSSFAP